MGTVSSPASSRPTSVRRGRRSSGDAPGMGREDREEQPPDPRSQIVVQRRREAEGEAGDEPPGDGPALPRAANHQPEEGGSPGSKEGHHPGTQRFPRRRDGPEADAHERRSQQGRRPVECAARPPVGQSDGAQVKEDGDQPQGQQIAPQQRHEPGNGVAVERLAAVIEREEEGQPPLQNADGLPAVIGFVVRQARGNDEQIVGAKPEGDKG